MQASGLLTIITQMLKYYHLWRGVTSMSNWPTHSGLPSGTEDDASLSIINHIPNAVIISNPDYSIRYTNPAFEKLSGRGSTFSFKVPAVRKFVWANLEASVTC